jgi:hypothetical protein
LTRTQSGVAGTAITLTNTSGGGYTFSRYTEDGVEIEDDAFILNNNATINGVFTADGCNSEPEFLAQAAPTLKIDGVLIEIPAPVEGVNAIELSGVVSEGAVTEFSDPDGYWTEWP